MQTLIVNSLSQGINKNEVTALSSITMRFYLVHCALPAPFFGAKTPRPVPSYTIVHDFLSVLVLTLVL